MLPISSKRWSQAGFDRGKLAEADYLLRQLRPWLERLLGIRVCSRVKDEMLEALLSDVLSGRSAISRCKFSEEAEFIKALKRELVRQSDAFIDRKRD